MPQTAMNDPNRMIPALKVAVIVMGVLIVIGLVGLGYMVIQKLGKREAEGEAAPVVASATTETGQPAVVNVGAHLQSLGLPKGSTVGAMQTSEDRLVLTVRVPEAGERIVIIDLRKGTVIGHVALEGASP